MKKNWVINMKFFLYIVLFISTNAFADNNLKTCLSGKYPALCDKARLSPDELEKTNKAILRENLATCLIGKYPALCNHSMLLGNEADRVKEAERKENLKICLVGKYPALCKHNLLVGAEVGLVTKAEEREVKNKPISNKQRMSNQYYSGGAGCEAGHWINSVSSSGEIVKLEDGSVWRVSTVDTLDSILWLPTTDIVACDDKLINTEDNETVEAVRLK